MAFLVSGSEHTMTVSARAILAYLHDLHLGTTKIGKRNTASVQASKSAVNAAEWSRMDDSSLAG